MLPKYQSHFLLSNDKLCAFESNWYTYFSCCGKGNNFVEDPSLARYFKECRRSRVPIKKFLIASLTAGGRMTLAEV